VDTALFSAGFWLAFLIRFVGEVPPSAADAMMMSLPTVALLKLTCFLVFGVMRPPWRHISFPDVKQFLIALVVPTLILASARMLLATPEGRALSLARPIPFGVLAVDMMLGFLGAG